MPTNPLLATKNPDILLARIKREFPGLAWNRSKYIDVGWDHEVMQLDDKYIFRFPNSPEYLSVLKDEVGLLTYLSSGFKARMPNYSYVAQDFSFGGYEMLPGEELGLARFNNLTEVQQEKLAQIIADFLSNLHSINVTELAEFNIGTENDSAGYGNTASEAEEYLKPNLSYDEFRPIAEMLEDIIPIQEYSQPARLIHGDVAPKHLIWDMATETVGFIDFSDRVVSDPAYDFAELYTYGEPFVNKVYEFYLGPDKDEHFLTRAKMYMKAIGVHSLANTYRTEKIQRDEAMRLLEIGRNLTI
jgi:aminoglycoside phosphotransferase (APT) family kinase protein